MRKSFSNKQRFEIFRRDGFTCQYCGRKPPHVELRVDHIDPVILGGPNDSGNLITTCFECNSGKSDSPILASELTNEQQVLIKALSDVEVEVGYARNDLFCIACIMAFRNMWGDKRPRGSNEIHACADAAMDAAVRAAEAIMDGISPDEIKDVEEPQTEFFDAVIKPIMSTCHVSNDDIKDAAWLMARKLPDDPDDTFEAICVTIHEMAKSGKSWSEILDGIDSTNSIYEWEGYVYGLTNEVTVLGVS